MNLRITRTKLIAYSLLMWGVFAFLFIKEINTYQLENITGTLLLVFLPGTLTLLSLRLPKIPFYISFVLAIAFSLLELMIVVLVSNYFLPLWKITQTPLSPNALFIEITVWIFFISIITWLRLKDFDISTKELFLKVFAQKNQLAFLIVPIFFVFQSIAGAFILNNGGTDTLALATLGEVGIYLIILTLQSKKIPDNSIAFGLSLSALALLFMTSMRGWYITGHDIQHEYLMFSFAKSNEIWSMGTFRDQYNACMSITILPTIFYQLLHIRDVYVFKFLFQIFFAFVPGVVYFINRFWMKRSYSILATIYFISFPTFFLDMPFLVRQEIAFIFYGLMLYFIFDKNISAKVRRGIFLTLGIGVILSHYSTTYTVIIIMLLSILMRPLFHMIFSFLQRRWKLTDSSMNLMVTRNLEKKDRVLTFNILVILTLICFVWTSIVTKTGGSLTRVVEETFIAIGNGFTENSRSVDVVNLISFNSASQQEQLDAFIKNTVLPERAREAKGTYYDESTYAEYVFTTLADEKLPTTILGHIGDSFHIHASGIIGFIGQIIAKLIEILAPFGLLYVLFQRRHLVEMTSEMYLLAVGSFIFVAMNIVLPVLSTEYGIYRAILQSLFVIAFLIVVATAVFAKFIMNIFVTKKSHEHNKEGVVIPLIIAMLFYFYGTAFLPQLFGENTPLLHLNNSGRYYDTYLIHLSGDTAGKWLKNFIQTNPDATANGLELELDHSSVNQFTAMGGLSFRDGIFPGLVRKDAYVFVTKPTYANGRSTIRYKGDQVVYSYPISFLDDNKDLLYDNSFARIYR